MVGLLVMVWVGLGVEGGVAEVGSRDCGWGGAEGGGGLRFGALAWGGVGGWVVGDGLGGAWGGGGGA